MTLLSDLQTSVVDLLGELGTTCTVHLVASVYDVDGTVTETVTTHTIVPCTPLSESQSYGPGNTSISTQTGMLIPGTVSFVPEVGSRVVVGSRTFEVTECGVIRAQAGVVAYSLTLAEKGAA